MNKHYSMSNPSPDYNGHILFMVSLSSEMRSYIGPRDLKIEGITSSHHGDYMGETYLYVDNRYDANEVWLQLSEKLDRLSVSLPELKRQSMEREAVKLEDKASELLQQAAKLRIDQQGGQDE